jgi:hypothetical protein
MDKGLSLEGCNRGYSDFEGCAVKGLVIPTSVFNYMNASRGVKLMKASMCKATGCMLGLSGSTKFKIWLLF